MPTNRLNSPKETGPTTRTGLDDLLEEQSRKVNHVVIEGIRDDSDKVKITPLSRGLGCICDTGVVVPRTAIGKITRTGRTLVCCGKTLYIVDVEFTEEKLATYNDVFDAMRSTHTSTLNAFVQRLKRLETHRAI